MTSSALLVVDMQNAFCHPQVSRLGMPLCDPAGTVAAVSRALTTVCVESTVRAAFMRDYRISLLTEACDDIDPSLHDAGVEVMTRWGFATPAKVGDITADPVADDIAYSEV